MRQVSSDPRDVSRPPPYAWDWLQRSRPVLQALAERLTGRPVTQALVDDVRAAFDEDPFVRAVVMDTIADVAFSGRVPRHRPAGVTWDRGLSWWAATLAGVSRRDFETSGGTATQQPPLFADGAGARTATGGAESGSGAGSGATPTRPPHTGTAFAARTSAVAVLERRRLADALRQLADRSTGGHIPVEAVRQLIDDLESPG